MLDKERRRAKRRWRSRCKFMRRLRADWNDHGWRRDPLRYASPQYHKDGTSLCPCFYDPEQQARFKDTPTGRFRKRDERDDFFWTYREERQLPVERETHGGRKKPRAHERRRWKVICFSCGFLMGFVWASPKERYDRVKKAFGDRIHQCENCRKRKRPA